MQRAAALLTTKARTAVVAMVVTMVVGPAACSSASKATGPSSTRPPVAAAAPVPVAGAFGPGVFIAGLWSDPWVAVGWTASSGGPTTACFLSPEGRTWTPCALVPIDTDGYRTRLLSVARVGSTLVAGGVAVGALHGNLRPYLFAGPVGGPFTELNLPRELFGGENIITYDGLTAGPLGAFAVGTYIGVNNQAVAQVWRSANGADWQRLDGVASLSSTPDEILAGRAVAVGAHRVVVVGTAINLRHLAAGDDGAAWWSDDGSSWTRADLQGAAMGGPGQQELRVAAAVGEGFVAGGSDDGDAAVWSSVDGTRWRRADPLPGGAGSGSGGAGPTGTTVTALAGGPGHVWAAGVVNGSPRLWSSPDGQRWRAVTVPPPPVSLGLAAAQAESVALAAGPPGDRQLLVVVQMANGSYASIIGGRPQPPQTH